MKKMNPLYIDRFILEIVIKGGDFDLDEEPLNGRLRYQISHSGRVFFEEDFSEAYYTQSFRICRTTRGYK